jgi:hypothetical protein
VADAPFDAAADAAGDARFPAPSVSEGPSPDAGLACTLLTGPVAMPFKRHGTLVVAGDGVDVVFNDGGTPHVVHVSKTAKPKSEEGSADVNVPPCAVTASHLFCPDAHGAIHRYPRGGSADEAKVIARAYEDTRIDAVTIGETHSLVAWIVQIQSEAHGPMTVAKAMLDDGAPERIDDTGATEVALAPRGDGAIAITADSRRALTLVHARALSVSPTGGLSKGDPAAIFAGSPSKDGSPRATLATDTTGRAFALFVLPDDAGRIGMAAVRVDDPPRLDEPSFLTPYPGPRGRLTLAATRAASHLTVARVRATGTQHAAPVVLEVGRLDPDSGAFTSLGLEPTDGDARDASIAEDADGDLWLLVTDHTGSFVERRKCP